MRTLIKMLAGAVMLAAAWAYQAPVQAEESCGGYFSYCGGSCDKDGGGASIYSCNNMGYGAMASECSAWCAGPEYPAIWSGGNLQNYYADPVTGEDQGLCLCYY
jgi:hypothetical protein